MAVPKSKTTPSKRGKRRSHDALKAPNIVIDKATGEYMLSHHISSGGYYNERKILKINAKKKK